MRPLTSHTSTQTSRLRMEFLGPPGLPVRPQDVGEQLTNAGWLCGLSRLVNKGDHNAPLRPNNLLEMRESREHRIRELEPTLISVDYGSPLVFLLGLPREIVEDAAAMSLLVFGLKQLWGVDLELRTHREDLRARLYEAQRRADHAKHRARAVRNSQEGESDLRQTFAKEMKREEVEEWGKSIAVELEDRRQRSRRWTGKDATWFLED